MIIIPARLNSTRYPKKMLDLLDDVPLIVKTAQNAALANVAPVVVACDDELILKACKDHKIDAIMTSKEHQSGTDRCAEAARILGLDLNDVVLNIQGDEPFLEKSVIQKLFHITKKCDFMSSLAKEISAKEPECNNPNVVKLVLNTNDEAIYFSRSQIPFVRDNDKNIKYLCHLGVYGFKNKTLQEFTKLSKSPIEDLEKLEQLRAIYHAKKINIAVVETNTFGIDTKEDMLKARNLVAKNFR
ncbi:MAG: 3-deoxy-manno-octulosonate cytidylyltransferase [Helicobacter sp.]|nr:3-deoxy-manno-octulosonate cytidylyltransferase [Helicobacter sp.]